MIKAEITVPLLNANEPEARVAQVHARDGQAVARGEVLFTIETTKAAADMESPADGFFRLLATEGAALRVGDRLAVITDTADEPVSVPSAESVPAAASDLRITKPARALADSLGLDLASLPADRLITESVIRELAAAKAMSAAVAGMAFSEKHILIYGGGGHAKAVMDLLKALGEFEIAGIVDDGIPPGSTVMGIPVLGARDLLPGLVANGLRLAANGVGGIVDIGVRVRLFELLENQGFMLPALVHPRATVEPGARIGAGVQVFPNAYVGSESVLHPKCMVNTGAVVSHDCEIGAYSHIAPGALLAGHVHVGERALVGMGVKVVIGITLGDGARVGSGATVLANVPAGTIVPAGSVWRGSDNRMSVV